MTLIIGIKCEGGYVLGADGAATSGVRGTRTIRQSVKKKLRLVANQGVVGVSGPVGIGQRFWGEVCTLQHSGGFTLTERSGERVVERTIKLSQAKPHDVMAYLRHALWKIIGFELDVARSVSQSIGAAALSAAISDSLVCLLVGGEPCLFQFDQQGAPEEITDDLPFVSIGSGQLIVDPFLAFLRRIYWPNRLPTVEQGVFTTIWALHHAIVTNAGGVGEPMQVITFSKDEKGVWLAKELAESSLGESLQSIQAVEGEMRLIPQKLTEANTSVPAPPEPTAGS